MLDLFLAADHLLFAELAHVLLVGIGGGGAAPRGGGRGAALLDGAAARLARRVLVTVAACTVHRHCVAVRVVNVRNLNLQQCKS